MLQPVSYLFRLNENTQPMRTVLLLLITTISMASCSKMKQGCYACRVNATGDDTEEQCGLTPNQARKLEKEKGLTCYLQP